MNDSFNSSTQMPEHDRWVELIKIDQEFIEKIAKANQVVWNEDQRDSIETNCFISLLKRNDIFLGALRSGSKFSKIKDAVVNKAKSNWLYKILITQK